MTPQQQKSKELVCEKCNINPVGARFFGKDVCIICYDKINNELKSLL